MSSKSLVHFLLLVLGILGAYACGSDSMTATGTGGVATTGGVAATGGMTASAPSFSQIKSEILDAKCNLPGCHQNPTAPGNSLNLAVDPYNALLGMSPTAQKQFVVPGDTAGSYLLEKLQSATPTSGQRMPLGAPLGDAQIMMVSDWIAAGALNN